ncbi:MAG: hypothetical protein HeimC3_22770 [Candidatus Heimdallarchaeota archaeon LC_3]|nr:MAG: hypothetical protein HeimC3_22770 [Candidatus Heimdallarchaeota archaeon LC_3]
MVLTMKEDYFFKRIGENLIKEAKNVMRESGSNFTQNEYITYSSGTNKYALNSLSENRIQDLINSVERL